MVGNKWVGRWVENRVGLKRLEMGNRVGLKRSERGNREEDMLCEWEVCVTGVDGLSLYNMESVLIYSSV